MSADRDVQSGSTAAAAPVAPAGNPAILGLATFLPGALTLGLWLVGYLDTGPLPGGIISAVVFSSGLFLLVSCIWAARIGASAVAGILGTFSAFWLSLGFSLVFLQSGLIKNATDGSPLTAPQTFNILATFLIAWLIVFTVLTLATFRLPLGFTAGFVFVVAAVAFVLAFVLTGASLYATLGGICVFVFCAIFAYIFFDAMSQELGGRAMPMGNPIQR